MTLQLTFSMRIFVLHIPGSVNTPMAIQARHVSEKQCFRQEFLPIGSPVLLSLWERLAGFGGGGNGQVGFFSLGSLLIQGFPRDPCSWDSRTRMRVGPQSYLCQLVEPILPVPPKSAAG